MKQATRILAAIMFADIVGYTTLMQEDEQKAKTNRDRYREILDKLILNHHGSVVQYYGDGTLSIFGSAVEAVTCAIEIQQELQKEPQIPVRIGIHSGDIVYDDEGIYGDGVNIASRIESLSVAGAVLVSDKVYDELHNQPLIISRSLGKFDLKNVRRPVGVFAIASKGIIVPNPDQLRAQKTDVRKSIAVLPFVNMSADPENEYFSDGITEEILNALAKVEGLQVTSRTSSFAFKGKNEDVRKIGNELDVQTVLEGSVRKAGNRVRITSQLINTIDGYHIWSETYDRNLEDIFEVQDEISQKIVHTLREKLTGEKKNQKLVKARTDNLEAYNYYLKGQFHLHKWTPDDANKAIDYFKKAIELETSFAAPYSGLAGCYTMIGAMGQADSKVAYPLAKENALKAIELNPLLAEAHTSLAMVKFYYELDLKGSYECHKKALELNPNSADVRHAYVWYLMMVGKIEEAVSESELAIKLDPLSGIINLNLATVYWIAGEIEKSIEQHERVLEMNPTFRTAIESLGWVYVLSGNNEKALEYFNQLSSLIDDPLKGITGLGYTYAKMGELDKVVDIIEKLIEREKKDPDIVLDMDFAMIYEAMNDYDKVFYHMEKAFKKKMGIHFTISHPGWKNVRKDPRYKELLDSTGIKF